MKTLRFTIKGTLPLLQNNPQCADPMNKYSLEKKPLVSKSGSKRTPEEWQELNELEIRSKIYWDDGIGIYVPARWVIAAIAKASFKTTRKSAENVRSSVIVDDDKIPLNYSRKNTVKKPVDIVRNEYFWHKMILPQGTGRARLPKVCPIFHDWSFKTSIVYDDSVFTEQDLKQILNKAARFTGFGDFRPTFGKAEVEFD